MPQSMDSAFTMNRLAKLGTPNRLISIHSVVGASMMDRINLIGILYP